MPALKSDKMTIQDGKVTIKTPEGASFRGKEDDLVEMMQQEIAPPLNNEAMPDGLKFVCWQSPYMVLVHQQPAHVRSLQWLANDSPVPFGNDATYRQIRISVPYTIIFACIKCCDSPRGYNYNIVSKNEMYFSNAPLINFSDKLYYPALLNISDYIDNGRRASWICTQYLKAKANQSWVKLLNELIDHTWNGGFNLSSEHNEGASWFATSSKIIPQISTIETWQAQTKKDEAFALSVPWIPSRKTVGDLVKEMFLILFARQFAHRESRNTNGGLLAKAINYLQSNSQKGEKK